MEFHIYLSEAFCHNYIKCVQLSFVICILTTLRLAWGCWSREIWLTFTLSTEKVFLSTPISSSVKISEMSKSSFKDTIEPSTKLTTIRHKFARSTSRCIFNYQSDRDLTSRRFFLYDRSTKNKLSKSLSSEQLSVYSCPLPMINQFVCRSDRTLFDPLTRVSVF